MRTLIAHTHSGRVEVCDCCGSAYVFVGPLAMRMDATTLRDTARLLVEAASRLSLVARAEPDPTDPDTLH